MIAITGLGAVSAAGHGVGALRDALREGRHGLAPITRFDVAPFAPVHLGGCVDEEGDCLPWAVAAAEEAWADADLASVDPARLAVVAGTTEGDEGDLAAVTRAVAGALGARGPGWTVSTACTSSANAIGLGADLLARGDADVVIAGGAEPLVVGIFAGFHRLGVLATDPCAPFGETRGTTLGEGAGFVVLERAGARPRLPWAYLHGYGLASDAWHATSPEPRGGGIARAIAGALGDAGIGPEAIDYVNVHGTGTAANDDAEWRGTRKALGARAEAIPLSGTKSFLGHAQGAAGALELIATLLCMREGTVPPTLRVGRGRPGGPPDPVAAGAPRPAEVRHALSSSSAFGGANVVLCVGRAPLPSVAPRREVRVAGLGVVANEGGAARDEAAVEALAVDLRNTDPSARMSLDAAARALSDAGLRIGRDRGDRTGIFAGGTRVSPESLAEYRDSIDRAGLARCSASAFSRLVLHATAGAVSRLLGLRGPTTTLAADGIAGLMAFAYAADHLARRDDADVLLALGFDERAVDGAEDEGAACAALSAEPGPGPRVAGWCSAGAGRLEEAIDEALRRAGRSRAEVDAWMRSDRPAAEAPSLASARLAVRAALAIREGARVAVAAADGPSASCAIVLTGEPKEGGGE